ncbi:MAG: hypothetical protein F4153_03920 [Acidimicrobiia bacterium]|nr:hypothetical protein [Acidimicrobiia bacterium]
MAVGPLRFFHVNVNCSDLERSLAFYRDLVGLKPTVRTRPERPQPGGAFGLDEVQWDAWILSGDDAPDGVVLDLLECRCRGQPGRRRRSPSWASPGCASSPTTWPTCTDA